MKSNVCTIIPFMFFICIILCTSAFKKILSFCFTEHGEALSQQYFISVYETVGKALMGLGYLEKVCLCVTVKLKRYHKLRGN